MRNDIWKYYIKLIWTGLNTLKLPCVSAEYKNIKKNAEHVIIWPEDIGNIYAHEFVLVD